jgi:hypothetical protein
MDHISTNVSCASRPLNYVHSQIMVYLQSDYEKITNSRLTKTAVAVVRLYRGSVSG